uniref:Titin n=1 Tax=Cyclopterus lumpus TaxID=8103 RepID=A0A8C2ZMI0_CYCLU
PKPLPEIEPDNNPTGLWCFCPAEKLKVITPLKDMEAKEGQEVVLNCEVNSEGAKAKWLKNEETIFESSKYVMVQRDNVFSLRIRDAQKGDEANYTISLTNQRAEQAKSSCNLTVKGRKRVSVIFLSPDLCVVWNVSITCCGALCCSEESLRIVVPLEDIDTQEKKTISFSCKVNRPNATLKWMKAGEEIAFNKRVVYRVDKDKHTLTIKDCTLADEGEYTAAAGDSKSTAELIISEAPTDFSMQLKDQTITEFDDAEFTCKLTKEKADAKWYRNGREIREGPRYTFERDGKLCTLRIKECRPDDECEYACGVDEKRTRARLFVDGTVLWVLQPPQDAFEPPGSDIVFEVELNKDRQEVKWLRNNMTVVQGDKYQMVSEGKVHRLQVCEIRPRDQGEYRIVVKDKDARAKLELAGEIPPEGPRHRLRGGETRREAEDLDAGHRPRRESRVHGDRPPEGLHVPVQGLRQEPGRQRTQRGHRQTRTDVPEAPLNVIVGNVSKFGCSVSWEPPESDGGSPVTSYVVELRDRTSVKWTPVQVTKADDLSAVINDVIENKEYIFRVKAQNKAGEGKPSAASRPCPSPPQNLVHQDQNKSSVQLSWETPLRNGGSMITGYVIERCEEGTDKWLRCNLNTVPVDLVLQKPGSCFTVKSPLHHASLSSPVGPSFDLSAFKDGLEVIVPQPLTIRVPITGYPTPVAKWTFGEKELTTADERVTLTTRSTFVELTVTPSVRPDKGSYTLTLENDVTAPKDFKVLEVTRGIFLTWEPPKYDGGTGIRGYNVERCQRGTDKWEPCGDMVPELKCQVTGLIEGQWYAYRVRALNRLGAGRPCKATDEIQAVDPKGTRKPPEIQLDAKLLAGLTAKAGSKIELPAEVTGKPEPRVKWTKADLVLKPDDRVSIDTKPGHSTVTIAKTKRDDSCTYIIEATNSSGRATATVDVNILGKTGRIKKDRFHKASVSFWLIKSNVPRADKPGPPAAFDISEITNETCFLAWNPPRDDGGSRVTNYIVERRTADSEIWHRLSSTIKLTTYKAVDLVKFKEYIFRVFAENQFGVGPPAEHQSIIARYPFGRSPDQRTEALLQLLWLFLQWLSPYLVQVEWFSLGEVEYFGSVPHQVSWD